MKFPLFRKYKNNKSYFKILSDTQVEEIKITGKHYGISILTAKILPESNFIFDLLNDFENYWEEIPEQEYDSIKNFCEKMLIKFDL